MQVFHCISQQRIVAIRRFDKQLSFILLARTLLQSLQTLNPPSTDPMQSKMMKIMPLVFSIMFFFFPAGLVLYWVVNNLLTIAQQWHINRSIEKQRAQGEVVS